MASANGCFPLFSRSHGKRVGYFGFRRETAGQRFGGNYDGTLVDESESAGVPPTHSREMSQRNGRAYSAAFWQRIRICRDTSVFRATSGRVLAENTNLSQQFCILRHPADGPGTSRRMSQSPADSSFGSSRSPDGLSVGIARMVKYDTTTGNEPLSRGAV